MLMCLDVYMLIYNDIFNLQNCKAMHFLNAYFLLMHHTLHTPCYIHESCITYVTFYTLIFNTNYMEYATCHITLTLVMLHPPLLLTSYTN